MYPLWDAAVAAGATLDELEKMEQGGYKPKFLHKVIAWKLNRDQIEMHKQDASTTASEKAAKKARRR